MRDKSFQSKASRAAIFIILCLFALIAITPFYFLITSSFKPGVEMVRHGISLNPHFEKFTLDMYKLLFDLEESNYFFWYKNSLLYSLTEDKTPLMADTTLSLCGHKSWASEPIFMSSSSIPSDTSPSPPVTSLFISSFNPTSWERTVVPATPDIAPEPISEAPPPSCAEVREDTRVFM